MLNRMPRLTVYTIPKSPSLSRLNEVYPGPRANNFPRYQKRVGRWKFGGHRGCITGLPALVVSQESDHGNLEGAIKILCHNWGWKQPSFASRWEGGVPSGQ